MTEWRECKLKDVCKYERISINPQKYKILQFVHYSFPAFDNNKTPEIQFGGQIKSSKYIVKKGYILYNKLNVRFKRIWNINFETPENSICSSEFLPILATKCNQDYLYYFLCSDELTDTMANSNTGTSGSHQRIDPNFLMKYDILLPPLPEQKAIAEVLSSLDDKIDLLTRQNKTLEDLAQAYFRKWFIEDASNKWEKKSLGEIVTINYGKALPERERVSGKIPVYSSAGVTGWHNQYLVNSRGIVIGRKGTIGTIYWVPEPFYCIDTAYYITPEDSKYDLTFIYFLLKTMSLQDLNEDSAVPGLNRNTIYSQEFLQPPDDLICKFIRLSNTLLQKIQSNTAQIHALSKLRDTLLPKLISGEIRVKM